VKKIAGLLLDVVFAMFNAVTANDSFSPSDFPSETLTVVSARKLCRRSTTV
jgi:hypothetical protein